ncbi:HIT family protein [Tsukamurella pseudospumae]|uniref:HIT family protein n=1 Tax=Tsukamurella pseudospumae TaxID=239498 RepID=UPI00083C9549|nr:HIT family protein [Tsukamurella pseudospumae]
MTTDACDFCAIARGEDSSAREVYRDEHVVAFFPLDPATLGHTLVIPRRHVPDIWSLDDEDAVHVSRVVIRLAHVIRTALLPEGLNVIQSNGEAATQTVDHLHVHLVPRWADDSMGLDWPETDFTAEQIDSALARIVSVEADQDSLSSEPSDEDRRKHLDHIQAVITRMSAASSAAKGWLLPVVVAAFGYAATKGAWGVALVGIAAVLLFSYLDANYLRTEREFRELYRVAGQSLRPLPPFTLNPADAVAPSQPGQGDEEPPDWWAALWERVKGWFPPWDVWRSWSILPFYGALVLVGLAILIVTFVSRVTPSVAPPIPAPPPPYASSTAPVRETSPTTPTPTPPTKQTPPPGSPTP